MSGVVRGRRLITASYSIITLRYRQNVSWQGSVHFSGDATVYQFRSVLELMGFMMEKFEELGGQGGEYARETVES